MNIFISCGITVVDSGEFVPLLQKGHPRFKGAKEAQQYESSASLLYLIRNSIHAIITADLLYGGCAYRHCFAHLQCLGQV